MQEGRLKEARLAKRWTQQDLADRSGFSRSSIINWESGKRAPRTADLERLADILEVPTQYLFGAGSSEGMELKEPPALKPRPADRKISVPGLDYWGGVVENARQAAEAGKDLDIIATMLTRALVAVQSAQAEGKTEPVISETPEIAQVVGL